MRARPALCSSAVSFSDPSTQQLWFALEKEPTVHRVAPRVSLVLGMLATWRCMLRIAEGTAEGEADAACAVARTPPQTRTASSTPAMWAS